MAARTDQAPALAVLVLVLALAQLALYGLGLFGDFGGLTFYLDPRIGGFLLFGNTTHAEKMWTIGRSVFPLLTGATSFAIRRWSWGVSAYIALEFLLSLPTLYFFVVVIKSNMSPAHGFSVGELLLPVISFGVNCAVPLFLGLLIHRDRMLARREGGSPK